LGDHLVVSVTADKYVGKGSGRPRFTEDERAEALKALVGTVDRVLVNRHPDAVDLIRHLKPAFYVKGQDYRDVHDEALTREAEAVAEVGGEMMFTSTRKWSSTDLLDEVRNFSTTYGRYAGVLDRIECDQEFFMVATWLSNARLDNLRLFFIGNGGSAAIASHMAADWQKAGKTPALCFNDAAQVTALANDVGYESVFVEPLRMHARRADILIAISSSGESDSIIEAAEFAKSNQITLVTLSGFSPSNRLRKLGNANFYVPSHQYGVVEASHLVILHSLLDAVVEAA